MTVQPKGNLTLICPYCESVNVILEWKNYLKQYRGMCPNKTCEVWSVVTEVKQK